MSLTSLKVSGDDGSGMTPIVVILVSERQAMKEPAGPVNMNLSGWRQEKMGQMTRESAGWGVCKAFARLIWGIPKDEGEGCRELLTLIDEGCREDCLIRNKHEGFRFGYI